MMFSNLLVYFILFWSFGWLAFLLVIGDYSNKVAKWSDETRTITKDVIELVFSLNNWTRLLTNNSVYADEYAQYKIITIGDKFQIEWYNEYYRLTKISCLITTREHAERFAKKLYLKKHGLDPVPLEIKNPLSSSRALVPVGPAYNRPYQPWQRLESFDEKWQRGIKQFLSDGVPDPIPDIESSVRSAYGQEASLNPDINLDALKAKRTFSRKIGKISIIDYNNEYGYITSTYGQEFLFLKSDLERFGINRIVVGQMISFEIDDQGRMTHLQTEAESAVV